jgi:hypothetical protein
MTKDILKIAAVILALGLFSCNSKPTVIEAESIEGEEEAPIFSDGATTTQEGTAPAQTMSQSEHKVTVQEVLNTDKYSYLRVTENGGEHWVAILKRDVKIGGTYYYTGGLLKRNFQSQEFNRTFETVYLVSDFREQPAGAGGGTTVAEAHANVENSTASEEPVNVTPAQGAVKIAELFSNAAKYEGKQVKVTGKVVKVNPMIINRNWLHLQDGSGKKDLTVTTTENVTLGSVVTLEGTIAVNKDFGAGYKYDVIMEAAVIK